MRMMMKQIKQGMGHKSKNHFKISKGKFDDLKLKSCEKLIKPKMRQTKFSESSGWSTDSDLLEDLRKYKRKSQSSVGLKNGKEKGKKDKNEDQLNLLIESRYDWISTSSESEGERGYSLSESDCTKCRRKREQIERRIENDSDTSKSLDINEFIQAKCEKYRQKLNQKLLSKNQFSSFIAQNEKEDDIEKNACKSNKDPYREYLKKNREKGDDRKKQNVLK